MSGLWGFTEPNEADSNKIGKINEYIQNTIKGISQVGSLVFPSNADYTPTWSVPDSAHLYGHFNVTGALSASTKNLIMPKEKHPWTFENLTTGGQSILVKGSTGTGITIANGARKKVVFDGTNFIETL